MKTVKNIALLSLIANIILAIGIYFTYTKSSCKKSGNPYNIAIFQPAEHPAMDEIIGGFMQTLETNLERPFVPTTYNANGNKTLLRAQAEEIVAGNFDLIFTIGAGCSQAVQEISTKKEITTPIVFGAVDDPVGIGMVSSLQSSGNHVTGVNEQPNYQEQLELLQSVRPDTKNILLVYDPGMGAHFELDKQELTEKSADLGMQLTAVELYNPNEISQKIPGLLAHTDAIIILKDHTAVAGIDNLIKLCNQYGVTLYASDLNSCQKGAALAYGILEKDTGVAAAHKAVLILQDGKKPADLPITAVKPMRLGINKTNLEKQGISLSAQELKLIALGLVY